MHYLNRRRLDIQPSSCIPLPFEAAAAAAVVAFFFFAAAAALRFLFFSACALSAALFRFVAFQSVCVSVGKRVVLVKKGNSHV